MARISRSGSLVGSHGVWGIVRVATWAGQLIRMVLTVLTFLGFFVGTAVLGYIILPWTRWRCDNPAEKDRHCRRVVARGFLFFVDCMEQQRLLRCDPRPLAAQLPHGAFVMVANHPTLVDVCVLLAARPEMRCIVKSKLFRLPAVGPLLRMCGHIETANETNGTARVMEDAARGLAAGDPLLFFPEGTRSPELGLGRFRRGGFEIACRAGLPVVAVLLRCEPPVLAKSAPWYRAPPTVPRLSLSILQSVDPSTWHHRGKPMAKAVFDAYAAALGLELGAEANTATDS